MLGAIVHRPCPLINLLPDETLRLSSARQYILLMLHPVPITTTIPRPGVALHFLPSSGTKGCPRQSLVFDVLVRDDDAHACSVFFRWDTCNQLGGYTKICNLHLRGVWVHSALLLQMGPNIYRILSVNTPMCTGSSNLPNSDETPRLLYYLLCNCPNEQAGRHNQTTDDAAYFILGGGEL